MAASRNTIYLQSPCGIAAFPSAMSLLKPDGRLVGTLARMSMVTRTRSVHTVPLQRATIVHHSLQLADISTNLKPKRRSSERQRRENSVQATFDADLSDQVSGHGKDLKPLQVGLAGACLVALDKGTALALTRSEALPAVLRNLPSSTVCMILVAAALTAISRADQSTAKRITSFFEPAVEIIQRWMPLFYTPALVMLSVVGQRIVVEEGVRLLVLVAGGWVVTLGAVALIAGLVKAGVQAEVGDAPNMSPAAPYSIWEVLTWAGVGAASGLVAYLAPNAFGLHQATVAAPFFICATVVGFLLGTQVPKPLKKFLHPVITATVFVNVITFLAGTFMNRSFETMLGLYVTKSMQTPGGGDILMALLGPLTLTYGFTLFRQRSILRHHATELGVVVPLAAIFSILTTVIAGRQLGLQEFLTRSVAARSTSLAFAIPVTKAIGGDESIAATAAIVTGLLGANLSLRLLSTLKVQNNVARALATACSAHGFGSAALASGDADLMPFCLVTYILMGAVSSLAVSIPVIRSSLLLL
ncbi:plastidal glycolate/glycerate translocator 1, chloroplastic [Physcomitrium patens]|uniref:LrgB-like protein n=1 Tax=Physcomitrium patens TaxID=3218 RepID=A9SZW4_PHYPA|nr:plastidal glycolate/glycerate translocator 1, chloroplastic-like [Physcomitrium patens]XP_024373341.1 plastidal glycolate/glycerate translocator 1, chloroplastic-like [Physcomitrium patens]PNR55019.1 hypothetical protein PHYPA_005912 [Physcomitrium patens]|eukprot:XP_024373340.1 plastidal glycolate/glycerate translocator 1, chloroplastic-like [Physcomitrella patens]